MKKLKLLFAVAALLLGGNTAYSLSWTGNEPAEGTFFLYNVGADKFINNGDPNQEWGTNAYLQTGFGLDFQLEANNGAYKLNTNVANKATDHYLATSTWCDGAATDWTFTPVEGETNTYTIENNSSYLVANDELNDVVYGDKTNDSKSWWKLVSLDDFKAAMQAKTYSDSDPMDVSVFIQGRSFARNDGRNNSWATTHNDGNWVWIGEANNKYYGNESWNNTFDVHQTIQKLPEGTYELQCSGFGTNGTTYIYATADGITTKQAIQTDNTTSYGTNKEAKWKAIHEDKAFAGQSTGTFTVGNGTLTVGLKRETNKGGDWCVYDEFRLYYYGLDLSKFAATLETAVSNAASLEGKIPTAAYTNLNDVVTTNNKTYTSVADYTTATNNINNAISTYASEDIVLAYARYQRIRTAVLTIDNTIDVTAADAAANAATTNTAVDEAVPTLRNAMTTAIASTESADIDLTDALIDNPSPGTAGKLDYWTTNQATGYGNNLYEFYNKTDASSSQTIPATMPIGYYKLTVVGYTRDGQTARMFVDKGEENVAYRQLVGVASSTVNNLSQGNSWIANGNGTNEMVFKLDAAAENNFTIGIWGGDTGDKWTAWRSFKLEYLGTNPLIIFQNDLADAVTAANAHATELGETIPAGAMNTYTTAISTAAAKNTTKEECLQSIQDIKDATTAADACVAAYASYNTLRIDVQSLYDVVDYEELTAGSHDNLGSALTTAATNVAAATTADDITTVTSTLKAAGVTYAGAANPTNNAQFDLTFMLNNPDVTKYWDGTWWIQPEGWASEQSDGNKQVMQNDATTNGDHKVYFEYWSDPAKTNGLFNLYTSITLPEGTFNMSCWAFAQDQGNPATNGAGVYFYANETQGSQVTSNNLTEQHIEFVNDVEQEVKIGLKPTSGNTYNWMGIGYVKLYKVPAQSYTVDENVAWDNTASGAGDVELNRTIKVGFNTLVLPFSMTQAEVEDEFGKGSIVYVVKSYDEDKDNISFTTHDGISANMPCLLDAKVAGTSYTFENRTIVAGEPVADGKNVTMMGTYEEILVPTDNSNYIISGGKIYEVDGQSQVSLKGTRAYITIKSGSEARTLTMSFDDTATGIATLKDGKLEFETGDIYDLSGRKVKNPTKGIYLMNGKKVIK